MPEFVLPYPLTLHTLPSCKQTGCCCWLLLLFLRTPLFGLSDKGGLRFFFVPLSLSLSLLVSLSLLLFFCCSCGGEFSSFCC